MFVTTIEWHKTAEELPEKTGTYIIHTGYRLVEMSYSKEHKMFNCSDWSTQDQARKTAMDAIYWAEVPDFVKRESEAHINGKF